MKLGKVIGRVTLNQVVRELEGARWLVVSPFTRDLYQRGLDTPAGMSKDPSLVVYDSIGGHVGQTIGYVEGREAAMPFEKPTPVDAINVALVDEVVYEPEEKGNSGSRH
jgi:microcompartment protein CcmK/EutM